MDLIIFLDVPFLIKPVFPEQTQVGVRLVNASQVRTDEVY